VVRSSIISPLPPRLQLARPVDSVQGQLCSTGRTEQHQACAGVQHAKAFRSCVPQADVSMCASGLRRRARARRRCATATAGTRAGRRRRWRAG